MMHGQPDSRHRLFSQGPWATKSPGVVSGWPEMELAFGVVLFADIVGFTALCEKIEPVEAFALLSDFHQQMADVIAGHGATLDDYVGDGALAMWITPDLQTLMLKNAISCGFAMRAAMANWNRGRAAALPAAPIGIGMHAGPVVVGSIGQPGRGKLGAFGDTVNVAHRIERMTRALGVDLIVSDDLFRMLAADAPSDERLALFQDVRTARLPGRSRPIGVRPALPVRWPTGNVSKCAAAPSGDN